MQEALSSKIVDGGNGWEVAMGLFMESSVKMRQRGSNSRVAVLRAMYSASVVLSAISLWSLLPQWIGQPLYVMT